MLRRDEFPLSAKYDVDWVIENEMGPNVLWLTESLCEVMNLRPGMRVLDMGCGKAMSSIFLAREFGCQVWATDLWIKATDNYKRIREAGVEDLVIPIHAEAHALPFANDFFDAITSLDSYHYYGTDVHYLEFHMLKLLKRGGQIGIVSPASPGEIPHPLPDALDNEWYWMNSVSWWRRHWERYPEIEVEYCDPLPNGWELWVRWHEFLEASGRRNRPEEAEELDQLRADAGRYLGFVRMVARRREMKQ
jgi:SAM-dependent methyltransferase